MSAADLIARLKARTEFFSQDGVRWYRGNKPDADCMAAAEAIEAAELQRIMTMPIDQLDAELLAEGIDPDEVAERAGKAIENALAAVEREKARQAADLTDDQIDALDTFALHCLAPRGRQSVREFARAVIAEHEAERAQPAPEPKCTRCSGAKGWDRETSSTRSTWVECPDCRSAPEPAQQAVELTDEQIVDFIDPDGRGFASEFISHAPVVGIDAAVQAIRTALAAGRADAQPADRVDAERLDWLSEHALAMDAVADPDNMTVVFYGTDPCKQAHGLTLRAAIDAAMLAARAEKGGTPDLCQNCGDLAYSGCNSEFQGEPACRFWPSKQETTK